MRLRSQTFSGLSVLCMLMQDFELYCDELRRRAGAEPLCMWHLRPWIRRLGESLRGVYLVEPFQTPPGRFPDPQALAAQHIAPLGALK